MKFCQFNLLVVGLILRGEKVKKVGKNKTEVQKF